MFRRSILIVVLMGSLLVAMLLQACANFRVSPSGKNENYLIGCGSRDITGPPFGIPMFGYVRGDQIDEGIHLRLYSRAFIIAEPGKNGKRVAFVSVDMGSVTHEIQREVVEKLQKFYGDLYTIQNVVISATHTHSGPGGYWHYGSNTPVGAPFYQEHFDAIVKGIVGSIMEAHEKLQPGKLLINKGRVENAGANRSLVAYMNDPAEERERYDTNTDTEMTLLKFVGRKREIGMVNWFAVHPTSMTFFNKLISGDHKGYASYRFEKMKGTTHRGENDFVAAFAQSNAGDVTSNLNLNNTGPGKDEFDSTRIVGERQLNKAVELYDSATERLEGPIDFRQTYVNFARHPVGDPFTHAGPQMTCPSAIGYSFAAGSTEDGGGHPLFHEGMKQRNAMVDGLVKELGNIPPPSEECRKCQEPKPILFATGEMVPPAQPQTLSLSLVRIGQLVLIVGPAEFTTMSGRRIRETVGSVLGESAKYLVIAGYANGYTGYVTTCEEYQTQQYEGGHTLFGPWSLALYQQEYARLAGAMTASQSATSDPPPPDPRGQVPSRELGTEYDLAPEGMDFGAVDQDAKESYRRGEQVQVSFWTGNPQNGFYQSPTTRHALIQRKISEKEWEDVARDGEWEIKCRWKQPDGPPPPQPYAFTKEAAQGIAQVPRTTKIVITWDIPSDAKPGTYRIVHHAICKKKGTSGTSTFLGTSRTFKVE